MNRKPNLRPSSSTLGSIKGNIMSDIAQIAKLHGIVSVVIAIAIPAILSLVVMRNFRLFAEYRGKKGVYEVT
jgi:predicted lipid-binding transport protein (Tim44 family)